MEFEATKPIFKNSAMRNFFIKDVLAAFESAQGHAELICLHENYKDKLDSMASGEDWEIMAYDQIMARYHAMHVRIDEQREWVWQQLKDFENALV